MNTENKDICNRCGSEIVENEAIIIDGHLYCPEYNGCSFWGDDPDFDPENGKELAGGL